MKKFAIHIHFFLTSKEAELMAYNNLKLLKKAGFTIIITSPKPLPLDFYNLIDFFLFDRENQLLEQEYEDIRPTFQWFDTESFQLHFAIQKMQPHGLAVLRSMIKGCQIAKIQNFDYIIRFEYDDIFGKKSLKNLRKKIESIIEDEYDFYLYRNDYGEIHDVSVHLMFYKPNAFLSIFEKIKDEVIYNLFLKEFGLAKKAIILEEFLWHGIKNSQFNIHYEDGKNQFLEFSDTQFNSKQLDLSSKDGLIYDVTLVRDSKGYRPDSLGLCVSNISSQDDIDVYFDVYDKKNNLYNTIKISISFIGELTYNIIDNCDNISLIKIRHNDNSHSKSIIVYKENNQVKIKDSRIIKYEACSQLVLK